MIGSGYQHRTHFGPLHLLHERYNNYQNLHHLTMKSKSKNKRRKHKKHTTDTRNWLELPSDLMANILQRVGVVDILENAQKVCTSWRNICKDPSMWRVLHMEHCWDQCERFPILEMCKHAVDRSKGQLLDLSVYDICSFEFLMYVNERSTQLRRLEIKYCYGDLYNGWTEFTPNFVLLEELSLHTVDISEKDIEVIGRYFPLLKILKVNQQPNEFIDNDTALAIGKNLPKLRHLELLGDRMSNTGLRAILDGCRHLESLDLRQCFHIDLKGDLGKRCSKQIKYLKLPNDPLDTKSHERHRNEVDDDYCGYWDDDYYYFISKIDDDFMPKIPLDENDLSVLG
ncbi:hypothetical protein QVD17_27256 [Tagetes erecta]|uniref:F-box domain-containing protein n=1 Tax=Tagetes erecta TaxID=13708 RepID=A0AAD8K8D8_TARER|nr:hypothetical protein QVD17_27256 [Tagetes erecta]